MAPAVQAGDISSALPIPINATPIVATVVQELPVITDTMAQMIQVVIRK